MEPRPGLAVVRDAGEGASAGRGGGCGGQSFDLPGRGERCGESRQRCPPRLLGVAGAFTVKGSKALKGFEKMFYEERRRELGLLISEEEG